MSPRQVFLFWFLLGSLAMAVIQYGHSHAVGGYAGLLRVGDESGLRPVIAAQIADLPARSGLGHDGQYYYLQGLDPFALHGPDFDMISSYRLRRVAYPAIASLGGVVQGHQLLIGMVVVAILSTGAATGFAAVLAEHFKQSPWLATSVVLNPGVIIPGLLLTADTLALAFGLGGLVAYLRGRLVLTVILLTAAALSKETAFLFSIGIAGYAWTKENRGTSLRLLGGVGTLLAVWLSQIARVGGKPFESAGQLHLPFSGLAAASARWGDQSILDNAFLVLLLAGAIAGAIGLLRSDILWRWMTWPWIILSALATSAVWDLGNNAIRVFAPVITLTVLGMASGKTPTQLDRKVPVSPSSP